MRQAPFVFSPNAVAAAIAIVLTLVGFGIVSTLATARGAGAWSVAIGSGERTAAAAPRAILGIYQTLINRDDTTAQDTARDLRTLNSYGWVDRSRGVVHIPIERAMELVAKEGL
ncbi:MAG TPA: hypothetical protein VG871_21305 [Vicinamibacterales bacterium]|nr:hypothetical protein [Vicinamibacterales bacterium]